jgi:superfamily I DNA and/or RNA helicase
MAANSEKYSKAEFKSPNFMAKRAGASWTRHVQYASLVGANFVHLSHPMTAKPGLCDYVLIDEVSMTRIPDIVMATSFATTGVVVGGDPRQLPPIAPDDADQPNDWWSKNVFEKGRVTDRKSDSRVAFLNTQYRMQPEIGSLISELFYDGELQNGAPSVPPLSALPARILFVHSAGDVKLDRDEGAGEEDWRRYNETHAECAAKAAARLVQLRNVGPKEIGIIAPYNAQVVRIRRNLREIQQKYGIAVEEVRVSTVHSFQGQERRVIIFDFTDDGVKRSPTTSDPRFLNVALSRAKEQLVMIGNRNYLLDPRFFDEGEIKVFSRLLELAKVMKLKL